MLKFFPIYLLLTFAMSHFIFSQVHFSQPFFKKPDEPIVYIDIPNFFLVQTSNGEKIIQVNSSEGNIERLSDTTFNLHIRNASISGITFTYSVSKNGKIQRNIRYKTTYLTAIVPDISKLRLGVKSNNKISLNELKLINKLALDDKDFLLKLNYKINCTVVCKPNKSIEKYSFLIRNSDLSGNNDFQELLQKLSKGDRIKFDNIKIVGNDGKSKKIESAIYTID
ncbi:MAG: hypothetical protein UZ11_BCD004000066 [Bacteroidetes bacterium OLB11]|nr:MAG: hypothetical protein UZ11_BCD004000066 [Bacteroidetes bacterium OLB11]